MIIGYTTGVFDLIHIGHLNILRSAKALCDVLIVGVATDELVMAYKKKYPIISFDDRIEVVRAVRYVDAAIRRDIRDKLKEWQRIKFNVAFVGDDWLDSEEWIDWERRLSEINVRVIYLPHTPTISSTKIMSKIRNTQ